MKKTHAVVAAIIIAAGAVVIGSNLGYNVMDVDVYVADDNADTIIIDGVGYASDDCVYVEGNETTGEYGRLDCGQP